MRSLLRIAIATVASIFLVSIVGLEAEQPRKPPTPEQTQIVDTLNTLFAAARAENVEKFNSVLAPNFYMFDGGLRLNGETLMALVKSLHAAGKHYEWNVTEPDVHISGDTAWIAYINKGTISDASGTIGQQWLESAFLEKQGDVWKIVFMHSTRVPKSIDKTPQRKF